MKKVVGICLVALASLAGAAVALAAGGYPGGDGYGYPTTSATTSSTTTAVKTTKRATRTFTLRAALRPKGEVPKPRAPARAAGTFTATMRDNGGNATVRWRLTFRRLSGKAMAAHIHIGRRGVAGPVVLPLCGPCKSGMKGRGTLTRAQARMVERGRGYVNVHTARNPGGEIRGQLRARRR